MYLREQSFWSFLDSVLQPLDVVGDETEHVTRDVDVTVVVTMRDGFHGHVGRCGKDGRDGSRRHTPELMAFLIYTQYLQTYIHYRWEIIYFFPIKFRKKRRKTNTVWALQTKTIFENKRFCPSSPISGITGEICIEFHYWDHEKWIAWSGWSLMHYYAQWRISAK